MVTVGNVQVIRGSEDFSDRVHWLTASSISQRISVTPSLHRKS